MSSVKPAIAPLGAIGLVTMIVFSCLAIVDSTHRTRILYTELEHRVATGWGLQEEWSRLLLEKSTWAAHHRVERVARDELTMHLPEFSGIGLLEP